MVLPIGSMHSTVLGVPKYGTTPSKQSFGVLLCAFSVNYHPDAALHVE